MTTIENQRVLGIYPQSTGLGFALVEDRSLLLRHGRYEIREQKSRRSTTLVRRLLESQRPTVLALEDWEDPSSRRCMRIKRLLQRLAQVGVASGCRVRRVSKYEIEMAISSGKCRNKDDRARLLADYFPPVAPKLPPRRLVYEAEHPHMGIFDALAQVVGAIGLPEEPGLTPLEIYSLGV